MNNEMNQIIDEAYKNYLKYANSLEEPDYSVHVDDPNQNCTRVMTKQEFIIKCKTDTEFSEKWGLKIEEKELSLEERFNLKYPGGKFAIFQENYPNTHRRNNPYDLLDTFNIPTKLITITYKDETIESYE